MCKKYGYPEKVMMERPCWVTESGVRLRQIDNERGREGKRDRERHPGLSHQMRDNISPQP